MKPQTVNCVLALGALALVGIFIYTYKAQPQGSYKDKTEGKNNIVRPGGAMKGGTKVHKVWEGAYSPTDPLTRSL